MAAAACGEAEPPEKATVETAVADNPAPAGHGVSGTIGANSCPTRALREYADKVVGGDDTSIALWPGFVLIGAETPDGSKATYECGGMLVDARTVITAAHCVADAMAKVYAAE